MTGINLSSFPVADLLRGNYKQSEYGRVILPFTVLRRLDCVLAPKKKAGVNEPFAEDMLRQRRREMQEEVRHRIHDGRERRGPCRAETERAVRRPEVADDRSRDEPGRRDQGAASGSRRESRSTQGRPGRARTDRPPRPRVRAPPSAQTLGWTGVGWSLGTRAPRPMKPRIAPASSAAYANAPSISDLGSSTSRPPR